MNVHARFCLVGSVVLFVAGCRIAPPLDPFYEAVLRTQPAHPGALYLQGQRMIEAGRFREAESYFNRMTRSAPRDPAGWIGLGHAQLERNRARQAERSFRQAMVLEAIPRAHIGLTSALLIQGKLPAAEAELDLYEQSHGTSASSMRLRGDLAFIENRFEQAAQHYQASLALDPNQPAVRDRLRDLERLLTAR